MDNVKKISPVGESWSEYRKKHYSAEEINANDVMIKLVGENKDQKGKAYIAKGIGGYDRS